MRFREFLNRFRLGRRLTGSLSPEDAAALLKQLDRQDQGARTVLIVNGSIISIFGILLLAMGVVLALAGDPGAIGALVCGLLCSLAGFGGFYWRKHYRTKRMDRFREYLSSIKDRESGT